MWYFAWMLGLPLAAILAVMSGMWMEIQEDRAIVNAPDPTKPPPDPPAKQPREEGADESAG